MSSLFQSSIINGLPLSNRLVRSATWEGMCAPDGRPTEKLADHLRTLALGGVGLIISGYAFVRPEGKQLPGKMGIHTDAFADDTRRLTDAVHEAGGRIALQLVHAGGQTTSKSAGRQPVAPSAIKVDQFPETPVELSIGDISGLISAFGDAARRAQAWGFDGIQLHGAHGYLINQFLSPLTNRRTDGYGGDPERRARFALEVYQAVRATVGPAFPVMIKLNGTDNLPGGLEIDEALEVARRLDRLGIDAVEISEGTPASGKRGPVRERIKTREQEAYNLESARRFKAALKCPVMVVGGFRSLEVVEEVIEKDGLDYVALSRPLIREPNLPNRWRSGDRAPARCISCNGCFKPGLLEGGIFCVQEAKLRKSA